MLNYYKEADKMLEFITNYLKSAEFFDFLIQLMRVAIALSCGLLIGYERTNRGKGAGIRTHSIVAIGACLMMIISQYGFDSFFKSFDVEGVSLSFDPSRVAAQIVSGIGFLGTGMIFIQKDKITGLTTAAGIWATAGIGMAIGCGMYGIGICSTLLLVIVQFILHKIARFNQSTSKKDLSFIMKDDTDNVLFVINTLKEYDVTPIEIEYKRLGRGELELNISAQYGRDADLESITEKLYEDKEITTVRL